jgi:hypothetical protein
MSSKRLISAVIAVGAIAMGGMIACSSSKPKTTVDAPGSGGSNGSSSLGLACPNNTCPAGYTCLRSGSDGDPFCSQSCETGSNDTCDVGFSGPGFGACIIQAHIGSGSETEPFCGIICGGAACTGLPNCDGSCPVGMQCDQELLNGSGGDAGSACG